MRVMHIISCLVKTDGHSLFCMRLAERLHALGHAQTIFTLPSGGGEIPDPQGLVQHADGRLLRFLNVSLPFGLERQIAALALFFKPDVVHLHGGWHPVLFFGACVARRMGIPILLSLHGSLRPAVVEGDRRLKKRLAWHLYQRRLVQMSSIVHVSTETEKEDLARLGFQKPIAVVPNGVDREDLSRQGEKPQREAESEDGGQRTEDGERSSFVHYCESSLVGRTEDGGRMTEVGGQRPEDGFDFTHELMNSRAHELPRDAARTRTVLYLGRLHPLKGLDLLVEAWARVRSSLVHDCDSALVDETEPGGRRPEDGESVGNTQSAISNRQPATGNDSTHERMNSRTNELPSWRLVIAGPDEQGTLARLKAQAEKCGLSVADFTANPLLSQPATPLIPPDILFTGPLYGEEKTRALQCADLFVLPTRSDNFGIAVAEALAAGVPVIATKGAPWEELLGTKACLAEWQDSRVAGGRESGVAEWQNSGVAEWQNSGVAGGANKKIAVPVTSAMLATQATPAMPATPATPATLATQAAPAIAANGRCGWWVDIGAEPLAAALREAMSLTDAQRCAMGENGRRLVERKYRWETVAEKMACVYRKLATN